VRAAFFAAWLRLAAPRLCALARAWRDKAAGDAAWLPSRFSALVTARDRVGEAARRGDVCPCKKLRFACLRVFSEVFPSCGGGSFTPARLALESPIAMACFVERAPCFPSRIWSISSRTNSPACVEGALPSRWSFRARSIVDFSGTITSFVTYLISLSARRLPGVASATFFKLLRVLLQLSRVPLCGRPYALELQSGWKWRVNCLRVTQVVTRTIPILSEDSEEPGQARRDHGSRRAIPDCPVCWVDDKRETGKLSPGKV
jgi:hypothetical protein